MGIEFQGYSLVELDKIIAFYKAHHSCREEACRNEEKATATQSRIDKKTLLEALEDCARCTDGEAAHFDADEYLLRFIGDSEITEAFNKVPKYYA